jgi:hypothetical protein
MARSRKSAAAGVDPRPIVTYSRVPSDVTDGRVEPRGLDPDATVIDAVEVPLVADGEAAARRPRPAPDLRADIREDAFDSFDPGEAIAAALEPEPRRRRGGRLLGFLVIVALAGGAGMIAASSGVFAPPQKPVIAPVTDPAAELIAIHKQIDALGAATTPEAQAELARLTKRLAELEQSAAIAPTAEPAAAEASPSGDIGPAVRQISLTPSDEATGAPAAAPPSPRLRPAKPAASAVAEIPDATEDDGPVAEPILPRPMRGASRAVALPPAQQPPAAATDDSFIASVEKALADSKDGDQPAAAGRAPVILGAPPRPLAPPPGAEASLPPPQPLTPAAAADMPPVGEPAPFPHLDADAADSYALPAPVVTPAPVEPRPQRLPPGVKLPPADIPNVAPGDEQY